MIKVIFRIILILAVAVSCRIAIHANANGVIMCEDASEYGITKAINNDITEYHINKSIDLGGDTFLLPDNTSLIFDVNGKLKNGLLTGNNVSLKGNMAGCFSNILFKGSIQNREIDFSWFDEYENDNRLLEGMLSFLFNDDDNEVVLILQPNRIYNIDGSKLGYAHALFEYYNKSNKVIIGNNSTINDLRTRKMVGRTTYDGVFLFNNCHDITIDRLNYTNYTDDYVDIYNGDELVLKSGFENQVGYVGTSFILLQNDCRDFHIEADIFGARYGVKSGDYSKYWLCGDYGLKNSTLKINAVKTGYPVAIEVGDSLNISVVSEKHHRAAYLCGISNSSINIEAKDIYIAPYHCLLSDSRYSKRKGSKPNFKACSDLEVNIVDNGTEIVTNKDCYCIGFQTYSTFKERTKSLKWRNIAISVIKAEYAPGIGLFSFNRMEENNEDSPHRLSDSFSKIKIVGYDFNSSQQYAFRIRLGYAAEIDDFTLEITAPQNSCIIENHNEYRFDLGMSTIGKINLVSTIRH